MDIHMTCGIRLVGHEITVALVVWASVWCCCPASTAAKPADHGCCKPNGLALTHATQDSNDCGGPWARCPFLSVRQNFASELRFQASVSPESIVFVTTPAPRIVRPGRVIAH